MSSEPTNRTPTCVACGETINESQGETPCYIDPSDELGEYDGEAYHLETCEDKIFDTVFCEVDP